MTTGTVSPAELEELGLGPVRPSFVSNEQLAEQGLSPVSHLIDLIDYDELEQSEGSVIDIADDKTNVIVVEKGYGSPLAWLLASACLIASFAAPFGIASSVFGLGLLDSIMAALVAAVIVIWKWHDSFYVDVDQMSTECYRNGISGDIVAYKFGLYVILPWETYEQTIDFKNDEVKVSALYDEDKSKTTSLVIATNDPYNVDIEWELLARPLPDADSIRNYLRYKKDVRESRIRALMNSRISVIGGRYTYQFLLTHFGEVSEWVRDIFGGDDTITPFEKMLGVAIVSPRLKSILCNDPAANAIIQDKPKGDQVVDITQKLAAISGISGERALETAELAVGLADRSTSNVNVTGLPQGARVVSIGGGALVGGGSDQGNNQGRRNKKGR